MVKLFFKDKPVIGLDISQTGIKVMAVDAKHFEVLGYGSLDLDPTKLHQSIDTEDDTYLADSLTALLKDKVIGTLPSNHVVVGVPTARTFSRTFTAPIKAEKNLAEAVQLEVEQYIPIPLNHLYVDYRVINRTKEELTIIMSAVPQVLVNKCLAAVEAAGLRPIAVEPGINAVARVLESTEEGHLTTLIVDVGAASTDIAVLDGGVIRVSGGIEVGGNTFTLDIAKKLDVTLENAHQLKVLGGLSAGPRQAKVTSALKPTLDRIVSEVRKVVRYYNERLNIDGSNRIEQVLIVGGGSNVPGLGEFFTDSLVMPARIASPWQKLNFAKLPQPNRQFRPRYITVTGLASVRPEEVWK